ncbi:MAG: hypothetical protein V1851_03400 [Patescibacteria group bacterium]
MSFIKDMSKRQNNNLYISFFSKKVEKIMSAIYLITDNFSDKESLKWKLRKHSADLFDVSMSLIQEGLFNKDKKLQDIQNLISQINSFLELGSEIVLISVMNLEVLRRELNFLLDFVENNLYDLDLENNLSLKQESFKVKDKILSRRVLSEPTKTIKDKDVLDKGHEYKKEMSFIKRQPTGKEINNNQKKEGRREIILRILSKGQKLTIKDISKEVKDCGEKTIQRELSVMLKEGILAKEGERRWSRYFLIK